MDLRATFVGFIMTVLGLQLSAKQQDVLWDLDGNGLDKTRVAVRTCNESGKTSHIATGAVLANAALHPGSVTVTTAGVYRQVKHQLWPNIQRHGAAMQGWEIHDTHLKAPNGSTAIGFSTDDADSFEGWHHPELLMIVDEAKAVPNSIYGAIRRCKPKRLLIMSSPGGPRGEFFDGCAGRLKSTYKRHIITAFDCPYSWSVQDIVNEIMIGCPHLDRMQVQVMVEKGDLLGLLSVVNDPLVRSMVFAEFMMSGEDEFYPFNDTMVMACRMSPPAERRTGNKVSFLDFAAGGDENVLAVKDGNIVLPLEAWRERDTMRACGEFIIKFRKHGLKPENIFADGDGMGIPILDRLAELGWNVNRVHNNSTALNPDKYRNRIAEMYWEAAKKVAAREIIMPVDDVLDAQLISRQSFPASDGRLQLESKKDMRSNDLPSPDRADAFVGVLTCFNPMTAKSYVPPDHSQGLSDVVEQVAGGALDGCDAGA